MTFRAYFSHILRRESPKSAVRKLDTGNAVASQTATKTPVRRVATNTPTSPSPKEIIDYGAVAAQRKAKMPMTAVRRVETNAKTSPPPKEVIDYSDLVSRIVLHDGIQ